MIPGFPRTAAAARYTVALPAVSDIESLLREGLTALGVSVTPALTGRFVTYLELLARWNRAYNLTSITDAEGMVVRHVLDSVTARPWLAGTAVLDAGSGAGLPGIPLALLEPDRRFTLADASGKKVRFLRQVVMELGLDHVTPVQVRLEAWQGEAPYDTVISRALASLGEFVTTCGHLAGDTGRLIAMKGRRPDAELAALRAPWRVTAVEPVVVPGLDAERHIVVMEH